jgi:hypothetical protein
LRGLRQLQRLQQLLQLRLWQLFELLRTQRLQLLRCVRNLSVRAPLTEAVIWAYRIVFSRRSVMVSDSSSTVKVVALCATLMSSTAASVLVARSNQGVTSIHVSHFPALGVTLTPPSSSEFEARVRALFPTQADFVLELRPYVAIVENRSSKTIVAYNVAFDPQFSTGKKGRFGTAHKYPDAVAGNQSGQSPLPKGLEIRTGEQRLVSYGVELDPAQDYEGHRAQIKRWHEGEFRGAIDLTIRLDAVLFDDGVLIGPNSWRLDEEFLALLEAKQNLYRTIVKRLDEGLPLEQALRSMIPPPGPLPSSRESPEIRYSSVALGDVFGWKERNAIDAGGDVFRRAMRDKPFLIRHEQASAVNGERAATGKIDGASTVSG